MKRRTLVVVAGVGVGAASAGWWQRNNIARRILASGQNDAVLTGAPGLSEDACVMTAEQAEGPFFVSSPLRQDITEDRQGLPLELEMQVVRQDTCAPVQDALVEIWHCDAAGRYSGYPEDMTRRPFDTMLYLSGADAHVPPENEKRYLRGSQISDAAGLVGFRTIFPGWYEPRVTHIHVKVFVEGTSYLTTQLYFPDELTRDIYGNHELYKPHGLSPYMHNNDTVLSAYPDGTGLLTNPRQSADGLTARLKLAVG